MRDDGKAEAVIDYAGSNCCTVREVNETVILTVFIGTGNEKLAWGDQITVTCVTHSSRIGRPFSSFSSTQSGPG